MNICWNLAEFVHRRCCCCWVPVGILMLLLAYLHIIHLRNHTKQQQKKEAQKKLAEKNVWRLPKIMKRRWINFVRNGTISGSEEEKRTNSSSKNAFNLLVKPQNDQKKKQQHFIDRYDFNTLLLLPIGDRWCSCWPASSVYVCVFFRFLFFPLLCLFFYCIVSVFGRLFVVRCNAVQ